MRGTFAAIRGARPLLYEGAKPADLPFVQPIKFEFVINLKTANALGNSIRADLVCGRGDRIRQQCRLLAVRLEGADHQWRKNPPGELSIDPVADERLVRVTVRAGASDKGRLWSG
jgi:hypothetical protein